MEASLPVDVENSPTEIVILEMITETGLNNGSMQDKQSKDVCETEAIDYIKTSGITDSLCNETVFSPEFEVSTETDFEFDTVPMETDNAVIVPFGQIIDDNVTGITLKRSDLESTITTSMKTNDKEHQACKSTAQLYNCDIPQSVDGENNTEMQTAPNGQANTSSVQITQGQSSTIGYDNTKLSEVNSEVGFSTEVNRRHGRQSKNIYVPDVGNKWYDVKGKLVTPPIDPKKLPDAFGYLPIYGRPTSKAGLAEFQDEKIREFVGFDLGDQEFENLSQYCRSDILETGSEIVMLSKTPSVPYVAESDNSQPEEQNKRELNIVKKLKIRLEKDYNNRYPIKLKYRGLKQMPLSELQDFTEDDPQDKLLEPGKDLIFRIRIYRGFSYSLRHRHNRSRHSVFSHDVVLHGRQRLCALRDRIVCANDADVRVDVGDRINDPPVTTAQDVFQSGFLFINNVFYVDTRGSCTDITAGLRAWAERRGRGVFPCKDMTKVRLDELVLKLGHPEVYMHQGNCEHLFTFSEIRLLNPSDPLKPTHYPTHTAVAQNQTIYCTACAEFGAKWIIDGCDKVPFDPAFFCDMCLKKYLYKDGKKLGKFKVFSYKVNEINILKPTHGRRAEMDFTEIDAPVIQRKTVLGKD